MEIEIWDGGLQEQEVAAIEKIKAAFGLKTSPCGSSIRDQLQGSNIMFPWKGYAGFRFVDSKNYDGEFDIIIDAHCRVIAQTVRPSCLSDRSLFNLVVPQELLLIDEQR